MTQRGSIAGESAGVVIPPARPQLPRSAGSFRLPRRGFQEPPKWGLGGRPGGKARGSRENRGVPGREKEIGQQSVVEGRTVAHGSRDAPVTGATAVQILPRRVKEKASPLPSKIFLKKVSAGG